MNNKLNGILSIIIITLLSGGVFITGIVLQSMEIEGNLGMWLGIISGPIISQCIGMPFKAINFRLNKNIANDIKSSQLGHDTRVRIKEIANSTDLEAVKISRIKREIE